MTARSRRVSLRSPAKNIVETTQTIQVTPEAMELLLELVGTGAEHVVTGNPNGSNLGDLAFKDGLLFLNLPPLTDADAHGLS